MTDYVRRAIEEAGECDYGRETRVSVLRLLQVLGPRLRERVRELASTESEYDRSHVDFFRRSSSHEPVAMRVSGKHVIFMDGTHRLAAAVKFNRLTIPVVVLGYEGDEKCFGEVLTSLEFDAPRRRR